MTQGWMRRVVVAAGLVAAVSSGALAQGTRAYVANRGASTVTVVDVVTAAVIDTITLEAPPHDVVLAHGRVYASMPTVNRLAVIDPVARTVIDTVDVPGAPRDLEVREQTLLDERIYISTDAGLRLYDPHTDSLAAPIAVGGGSQRAIEAGNVAFGAPFDDQAFVAACDGGAEVRAVTVSTGAVSAPAATGAAPCAVLLTSFALYVANRDDDTVTIFGPGFSSPVTVPVADQPIGLADTAFGIWVASANGTLTLISSSTNAVIDTLVVGGTPTSIAVTLEPGFQVQTLLVTDATGSLRMVLASGALPRTASTGASPGAVAVADSNPSDPVGLSTAGAWTDAPVEDIAMSADGRFVSFTSAATSLVTGDGNGLPDVFVRDRLLRRTTRVSVTSSGAEATGGGVVGLRSGSYASLLSADGRFVLFQSLTTNLVAGDLNGREDVFLHDRDVDADGLFDEPGQIATRRISVQSDGSDGTCRVGAPAACLAPHIETAFSADGRHVVFSSVLEFDAADVNGLSDIFAVDLARGRTTRLSQRPGGMPGAGTASGPVVSAGGRFVAFRTSDPGMVSYDTNGVDDAFALDRDPDGNGVFDEQAPTFTHVSLQPGGALYTTPSFPVAVSADGRWVAYASLSTLAVYDRSIGHNALVRPVGMPVVGVGQFSPDARYLSTIGFGSATTFIRIDRDFDADGILDEAGAVDGGPVAIIRWDGRLPATDAAARLVAAGAPLFMGGLAILDLLGPAPPPFDTDADGLGNTFESRFGLSPSSDTGVDGASGDPDGDGRTNAEEQEAGTHPRGFQTRYLAEGATGSFFSTRIAVANPGDTASRVLLRYLSDTGQTTSSMLVVPAKARRFVYVGDVASLGSASFSTVIEADAPIVADRTMLWTSGFYGSHAETSVASPSTTWFLAEGATHGAFDLFYLLQNPSATTPASVEIRFLRASGPPIVRTYSVPAARRLTVYVDEVPGLDAADVSAAFTSLNAVPIIVERAMYYSQPGTPFTAGHASAGVTAPATQWFLAEGATGTFFNLFLLLANPSADPADIRITYLRPNGAPIVKTRTLAPTSRTTINVALEDPALADTPVSTVVESLNAVGVVAERAMWWPASGGWQEAHGSPGATAAATRWGFGDGEVGAPPYNTQTYFLVANTSTEAASVRVTLLFDDNTAAVAKTFTVPANSRFNVPVANEFPQAAGKGFGALIESLGAAPVPIVVERAMYSDAGGVIWAAGTDALGTPIP
jgi:YVTN family beta-propeller protein